MARAATPNGSIRRGSMKELMTGQFPDGRKNSSSLSAREADWSALPPRENKMNRHISTVYSGPTIGDVEAALGISSGDLGSRGYFPTRVAPVPEKPVFSSSKMEGKFTMRMKCSSNGMTDDGYKWRKYGQKFIKNSPYPRSYYRCTNPRCSAKKQVERCVEDPETLVVTYEGLHLHYAFSHFVLPRPCDSSIASPFIFPSVKRAKLQPGSGAAPLASNPQVASAGQFTAAGKSLAALQTAEQVICNLNKQQGEKAEADVPVVQRCERLPSAQSSLELPEGAAQGLLEDVVPGLVRKPCSSNSGADTALSDPASLFSSPSSPLSSALSSPFPWPLFDDDLSMFLSMPSSPESSSCSAPFSWPHDPSFFDMATLPGTV